MSEIMGTINKLTKAVTQTSGTVLKTTKLSMALASEEDNLKSVYIEIGKKVHEIYMFGGSLGKFFDEKYKEISILEKKIDELKLQIDSVKGTITCPKCNKRMERTADFCQKCGYKITTGEAAAEPLLPEREKFETAGLKSEPAKPVVPAVPAEPAENTVKTVKCKVCGEENAAGSKFCLSCGRLM